MRIDFSSASPEEPLSPPLPLPLPLPLSPPLPLPLPLPLPPQPLSVTAVCMTAKDERLIRQTRGDEAYWWLTGGSEKTFDL